MISTLYIEEELRDHPRVQEIIDRFNKVTIIYCNRYTEIFNKKAQNFRIQKQSPALILARKNKNFVLPTPQGYGIGRNNNYYFSHMLNCLYDCRYCFLQGMYHSAHYVLFINYEDFSNAIIDSGTSNQDCYFSGYDCDSLALEPVTGFASHILDVFAQHPDSWIELRTKSTQIRSLLDRPALPNVIVAFSLSPSDIVATLEHKTPSLEKRLDAMQKLQHHGWPIGIRLDPLIYHDQFEPDYRQLIERVFSRIDASSIHSITLGTFRLPSSYFNKAAILYPDEPLFALNYDLSNGMQGYPVERRKHMIEHCLNNLIEHIPREKVFVME